MLLAVFKGATQLSPSGPRGNHREGLFHSVSNYRKCTGLQFSQQMSRSCSRQGIQVTVPTVFSRQDRYPHTSPQVQYLQSKKHQRTKSPRSKFKDLNQLFFFFLESSTVQFLRQNDCCKRAKWERLAHGQKLRLKSRQNVLVTSCARQQGKDPREEKNSPVASCDLFKDQGSFIVRIKAGIFRSLLSHPRRNQPVIFSWLLKRNLLNSLALPWRCRTLDVVTPF